MWMASLVIMLCSWLSYVDRQTLAVLSPMILRDTGLSIAAFSDAVSAFSIAYMIGNPLWGSLLDRIGLRIGMLVAVGVWTLASVSHAWVSGFAGFVLALVELVEKFPVVDDPADGRVSGGRHLHQVQALAPRQLQGLEGRHDAQLLPFLIDYPDFPSANPLVHANKSVSDKSALLAPRGPTNNFNSSVQEKGLPGPNGGFKLTISPPECR
jgi:hypothetical protein